MAAHQAPLSLGFSRQEHWSGLPFPSPMYESEVTQSCPTLSDPMDCSLPVSSIHGIFQARVLEWVPFDCVDHNKLWKILKKDGNTRPPYLPPEKSICRQVATVRTIPGTMDWFQIGKGVHQGCVLSPCLFNLYAEYIM